jgi:hypothetical protein
MDLIGCDSAIEDLFWQMQCYPRARKLIIKTDKFMNLPESKDSQRLCGTPESRNFRNAYYVKWYNANYAKK